jgi:hypothetical protein
MLLITGTFAPFGRHCVCGSEGLDGDGRVVGGAL